VEHWFDEFTKRIANGPGTRRQFLGATGAVLASSILRTPVAFAQTPAPRPSAPRPIARGGAVPGLRGTPASRPSARPPVSGTFGPCTITSADQQTIFNYTGESSAGDVPVRLTLQTQQSVSRASAPAVPTLEVSVVKEITFGSQSVVRIVSHLPPTSMDKVGTGSMTMEISTGSLVTGLRSALLTFSGGRVSGTVNSIAIAPATATTTLDFPSLRYADGSAVPSPTFDNALGSAIPQLQIKARTELRTCSSAAYGQLRPQAIPGANWQNTLLSAQTPSCQGLVDGCINAWIACEGFSLGLGTPACVAAYAGCVSAGFVPGSACCGTMCAPFSCCDSDQQCCGSDVCCGPTSDSVCGSAEYGECCQASAPKGCGDETEIVCFAANSTCCPISSDYSLACPPGNVCLEGGSCCPSNSYCGGICCPTGQTCRQGSSGAFVCCDRAPCGGMCCDLPFSCVNGQCGNPCGNTVCGGLTEFCCGGTTCCATLCANGRCCPAQSVCGSICCASGQICSNGRCVTSSGCPDGMATATAPDGSVTCCQLYQCNNPSNDNICTAAACPGGVCCGQNQVCCPGEFAGQWNCSNPPCPTIAQ
jgi:hypothetical protein